jgi:PST family polysaccharide transporter
MRDLLRFGGGLTGFNIFNFLARNADNIMIGRVWGDVALGLYDRAYKLLLFPLQQVNNPLSRVMVPVLSRLQDEPERYRAAYVKTLQQILLLTQPGVVFLIATADWLIPTLLGEAWRGAVPIFVWLGLAGLLQPVSSTMGWLFISQGRTREFMQWGAFGTATCIAAFAAGLPWGPVGVAAAYALSDILLRWPLLWWYTTRTGPVRQRDLWAAFLPFLGADVAAFGAIYAVRAGYALEPLPGLALALCAAYGTTLLVLAGLPQGRRLLAETAGIAGSLLRKAGR